jgi:hypothetical protein
MSYTKIVKTTITIEVLHHEDLPVDDMSLEEISFATQYGMLR